MNLFQNFVLKEPERQHKSKSFTLYNIHLDLITYGLQSSPALAGVIPEHGLRHNPRAPSDVALKRIKTKQNKSKELDWGNSTKVRAVALYRIDPNLILHIPCGPLSTTGNNS